MISPKTIGSDIATSDIVDGTTDTSSNIAVDYNERTAILSDVRGLVG